MKPEAIYRNDGSVTIFPRYNPAFIEELRKRIPDSTLRWNRQKRCWSIGSSHAHVAIEIFKSHFPGATVFIPRSFAAQSAPEVTSNAR